MTAVTVTATFRRGDGVTWRDTGLHVVALAPTGTDVQVLGGGAAMIWAALETEASPDALVDRLRREPGIDVTSEQVNDCLDQLTAMGLLSRSW